MSKAKTKAAQVRTPKKARSPQSNIVDWADAFLTAFVERGNVRASCAAANIARRTVYDRLKNDAAFRKRFEDAREDAADRLEDEAWRRGHDGVEQGVYSQRGDLVGTETKYSDTLLIVLLKANRPGKFSERFKINEDDLNSDIDGLMAQLAAAKEADPA